MLACMLRACLLSVVLVALCAVPAQATIVPGEGMAGVRLQMTEAQVRSVLGSPTESRRRRDPFGLVKTWYFSGPKVHVSFRRAGQDGRYRVTAFFTRRGAERTAEGVGVGSTRASLRSRLRGERCETFRGGGRIFRSCHVGEFTPGSIVTDFRIDSRGRVDSVTLGFVID